MPLPARRSSSRVISSEYLRWAAACQWHTNLRFPSHRSFVILRIVERKPGWTALKTFDVSCGSSRRLAGQESPASSFLFIMMSISVGCSLSVVCGVGRAIIFWSLTLRSFRGTTRIKRLGVGRMVRTVSSFTMNSWKGKKGLGGHTLLTFVDFDVRGVTAQAVRTRKVDKQGQIQKESSLSGSRTQLSRGLFTFERQWQARVLTDILTEKVKFKENNMAIFPFVSRYFFLPISCTHNHLLLPLGCYWWPRFRSSQRFVSDSEVVDR